MNQLVAGWNLVNDILATARTVDPGYSTIGLRGSSSAADLNGEFRLFLSNNPGACLSVGDITGGICPRAVDVYLNKSPHSPLDKSRSGAKTLQKKIRKGCYQQKAGNLFENLVFFSSSRAKTIANVGYPGVIARRDKLVNAFEEKQRRHVTAFQSVQPPHSDGGNPAWFLRQLECCVGQELGAYCAQTFLQGSTGSIRRNNVKPRPTIELSDPKDIGIGKATPDFIARRAKLVGDIKTGEHFQYKYMLTCAGYAIVSERKTKRHIDWGAIVFEPTEVCRTTLYQPMSFPQLYFFRITDDLRRAFLDRRDGMYVQNQLDNIDNVAQSVYRKESETCRRCQHFDQCSEIFRFSEVDVRPAAQPQ